MAPASVHFVGPVSDEEIRWLYANSEAVIAASYEDYGLTPLESAAFGKPSIALRAGGFLDTVVEGVTGVFFDEPSPEAIAEAIREARATAWSRSEILAHAAGFTEERFVSRLQEVVVEVAAGLAAAGPIPVAI
jgi:glycosyltransferase involved in cell wall biosynthesis